MTELFGACCLSEADTGKLGKSTGLISTHEHAVLCSFSPGALELEHWSRADIGWLVSPVITVIGSCTAVWPVTSSHIHAGVQRGHYNLTQAVRLILDNFMREWPITVLPAVVSWWSGEMLQDGGPAFLFAVGHRPVMGRIRTGSKLSTCCCCCLCFHCWWHGVFWLSAGCVCLAVSSEAALLLAASRFSLAAAAAVQIHFVIRMNYWHLWLLHVIVLLLLAAHFAVMLLSICVFCVFICIKKILQCSGICLSLNTPVWADLVLGGLWLFWGFSIISCKTI